MGYHCYQLHTKLYQISFFHDEVHTYMKLLGTISVDFDVTDQLLIRFSAFVRYWEKVGVQCEPSLSLLIRGREHDSLFSPSAYCHSTSSGREQKGKEKGEQKKKKIQFLTIRKEQECNLK
jgi:hypothetical protein